MSKFRIVERTWSSNKKDYEVQEYSKKWYSKKYKWRTLNQTFISMSGTWKEPAIFSTKEEADKFIREETNCIIKERVIEEYEKIYNKE